MLALHVDVRHIPSSLIQPSVNHRYIFKAVECNLYTWDLEGTKYTFHNIVPLIPFHIRMRTVLQSIKMHCKTTFSIDLSQQSHANLHLKLPILQCKKIFYNGHNMASYYQIFMHFSWKIFLPPIMLLPLVPRNSLWDRTSLPGLSLHFCLCPRSLRYDVSKEWPLMDSIKGRTLGSIRNDAKKKKHDCRSGPLFDDIEMNHVIINTLHLFLRISDILIENLTLLLRTYDAIQKEKTFSNGFGISSTPSPILEIVEHSVFFIG